MRQAVRAIVIKDDALLVMHRNKFGREFYALVGGGIDFGESREQALHREVAEETGLVVTNPRLVIVEDAGPVFGRQYIYVCDYVSGTPALAANSEEALISADGKNLYTPLWLPLTELPSVTFLPVELHTVLVEYCCSHRAWPETPLELTIAS